MEKKLIKYCLIAAFIVCIIFFLGLKSIYSSLDFQEILRYIARGIYGKEALGDVGNMPLKGVLLHILISLIWSFAFFGVYPNFKFQNPNWIRTGFVYGLLIFFIMNFGVLPIAITKDFPIEPLFLIKSAIAHILGVGFPIAYIYIHKIDVKPEK